MACHDTLVDMQMIIAGTDTSSVTMFYMLKACQDDGMLEDNIATEVQDATGQHTCSALLHIALRT